MNDQEVRDLVARSRYLDDLFEQASAPSSQAKALAPGIHLDVPKAVYASDPCDRPSLNQSCARLILDRSPAHAWAHHPRGGGASRVATPEMEEGTLIDSLLLGGDTEIIESPYDDYRTKAAREWRDAQVASGRLPVKAEKLAHSRRVAARIQEQLADAGVVLDGQRQATVIWDDMGVRCRSRLDHLVLGAREAVIDDLKTTSCAAAPAVARSCVTYGYDIQHAAYTRAIEAIRPDLAGRVRMRFLFVELEPPYAVRVTTLAASMVTLGNHRWERALRIWRECLAKNRWPGYDSNPVEAPAYALADMERQQFEDTFR